MEKTTFAELESDSKKRRTRREFFLEKMDEAGSLGSSRSADRTVRSEARPQAARRYPLRTMLRVDCVQLGYELSGPGTEDTCSTRPSRCARSGGSGPLRNETTILNFRHLLETRRLGEGLFEAINAHLVDEGEYPSLVTGTVAATALQLPDSFRSNIVIPS